jgi:hypothetical protein
VLGYKDQNRIVLNHKFSLDRADKNTTITRPKEKSATVCTCFQDRQESFIEKQFELLQSPTVKLANRLLPEEMKIEIFKHVETQGLVTEGLADPNICGLARYILEKRFKGQLGAWAGNRIVCWGSDNNPGDYPKGSVSNIMTMEFGVNKYSNFMRSGEDDALDTLWGNGSTPTFEEHKDRSSDPKFASLPDLVYNSWIQPDDFDLPKVFQQGWSGNDVDFITGLDGHQITLKESYFYPTDQPWILRNLTTKEYVRADAIALKPDYIHGPFIDNIGFGEVVLFRTIWSSKKDCGLEWDDVSDNDHHRGVWAGHAFDITTVARHEKESKIKKEIWTDVSEEVRKEIRDVFRMERIFWAEL